jgi:hypothetical protein
LRAEERPAQVRRDDRIPRFLGDVEHRLLDVRAGVVDEDVDPPVALHDVVDHPPNGRHVPDVDGM